MRQPTGMRIVTALAVTIMACLLLVPLGIQLITALRGPYLPFGTSSSQWGFENFSELYGLAGDFGVTVRDTTLFVGGSALISILIAWGLAWLVVRTDVPGRNVIAVLVLVPFVIPPIVRAQGFLLMLAPESGVLNQLLRALPLIGGEAGPIDPFDFLTLTVVQGLSNVTFPFLLLMPILQNMNGSLEEAARASGASPLRVFRRITLPMLWPGTLGVVALSVMLLLGSLEIPLLFGQQEGQNIFALKLWDLITPNTGELPRYGLAAVYGMHFLVFVAIVFQLYLWATRDADRRAGITGKAFRPKRFTLKRSKLPVLIGLAVFLIPTAILPLVALVWASLMPFSMAISWDNLTAHASLDAFGAVLQDPEFWASLGRTAVIAVLSSTIAVGVAMVAAYAVARSKGGPGAKAIDLLGSSSLAIPATIAGFSCFLLFLSVNKWVPLYGTIWALVFAYSYRIAVAYRTSYSTVLQISTELEEAAVASGASRLTTFRRVVLPLLAPTAMAVWIQLVILGANEFTIAAFLATPESRPLSWYLYARINPQAAQLYAPSQGAAMAVIFTLVVLLAGYGLRMLANRTSLARAGRTTKRPVAADPDPVAPLVGATR